MRVLFTTTSGRGHFQPMLPLARALASTGHDVRWAAAEEVCPILRDKGFDALPAGIFEVVPSPLRNPPPEIAALPPAERPDHLFALVFGPLRAGPMLAGLVPIVDEWQPHLLVCEQGELAGPIVAARHGVPNVTHAFGRLLPQARVARARDSMADLWRAHALEPRPYAGTYEHLYVDIYPPSLQAGDTAHLGAVQLVRPVDPIASDRAAEPLVYVTLGTVFNDDLTLFRVAVEAAREVGIRVVVTLGPGNDPAVLGPQPSHVIVEQFIPQAQLLPACAAVVSHAGSGTFLAALAAGVPQVLLPQAADQFLNAQAGEQGGVALAVPRAELSVEKVRAALERVIGDGAFRATAERVRSEIGAMAAPEAVAAELERRYAP
jgi:UDP:flavonoid glycosyltransferase YjiC (YdhE family)